MHNPEIVESSETVKIYGIKEQLTLDEEKLKENFSFEHFPEDQSEAVHDAYTWMLNNRDKSFVGSGFNAIVYKGNETESFCRKCRWEISPFVGTKSKKKDKIPEHLLGLNEVQIYFAKINAEKKEMTAGGGGEHAQQNSSLREAVITQAAHECIKAAKGISCVPKMELVIHLEHEESGELPDGDTYYAKEEMYMLQMEKIKGFTIEEVILSENTDVIEKIDVEQFMKKLRDHFPTLHTVAGITHNDISLRNIMIEEGTLEPKIIDFGTGLYDPNKNPQNTIRDMEDLEKIESWLRKMKQSPTEAKKQLETRG